jgi:hypothetical protein
LLKGRHEIREARDVDDGAVLRDQKNVVASDKQGSGLRLRGDLLSILV